MSLSLVPCLWPTGYTQPLARLLHLFPIVMWFAVICLGNQSLQIVSFIWKVGPALLEEEWRGSQQSGVCLAWPVGHEHPPGPAQHGHSACLLASVMWEADKLHKGADELGGYLQSARFIFSHLVTGLQAPCDDCPWEIQTWGMQRWDRPRRG